VSDVTPLAETPLVSLTARNTKIRDLSPLKRKALAALDVSVTPITDLGPIAGMPLLSLGIESCARLTNYAPIATLTRLTQYAGSVTQLVPGLDEAIRAWDTNALRRCAQSANERYSRVPALASFGDALLQSVSDCTLMRHKVAEIPERAVEENGHYYLVVALPVKSPTTAPTAKDGDCGWIRPRQTSGRWFAHCTPCISAGRILQISMG